jgi:hypothetical protein
VHGEECKAAWTNRATSIDWEKKNLGAEKSFKITNTLIFIRKEGKYV